MSSSAGLLYYPASAFARREEGAVRCIGIIWASVCTGGAVTCTALAYEVAMPRPMPAPRVLGALVGTQGLFDGLYWLIPSVIVTSIGGILSPILHGMFVTPFLGE